MHELDDSTAQSPPVWAIFGDLMSGLVGVFVLILIWVIGYQLELSKSLQEEVEKRRAEEQRRVELERALEAPLASGRVTLNNGKIGISGNVLFALNSDKLQAEGQALLASLVAPLQVYLSEKDELLMVSGFTDDLPIQRGNSRYADNWDLSAQRALTVTRALIDAGMPKDTVFAAAFGDQQPVASNLTSDGRAKNRRVEMAPVPRSAAAESESESESGPIAVPNATKQIAPESSVQAELESN